MISFIDPQTSAIKIPNGFYFHLTTTLYEIAVAFLLTITIGLSLGFIIGLFKFIADTYEPLIYLAYAFPGVAIYPIIIIAFGFESTSKIIFGVFLGFFPMVLSVISALRSIKPTLITVAKSFGSSKSQLFVKVILPGAAPAIFTGIRLAMGLTIIGVLFAEMAASDAGLGWIISVSTYQLEAASQYAAVLITVIVAGAITTILRIIERKVSFYG